MEKCKACQQDNPNVFAGTLSSGFVCTKCRDEAIAKYIAEREAERPKVPTLEERVHKMMDSFGYCVHSKTIAELIAMIREHDAKAADGVDWKALAAIADAKLAAIRSELFK